jgi:hypothetical protein
MSAFDGNKKTRIDDLLVAGGTSRNASRRISLAPGMMFQLPKGGASQSQSHTPHCKADSEVHYVTTINGAPSEPKLPPVQPRPAVLLPSWVRSVGTPLQPPQDQTKLPSRLPSRYMIDPSPGHQVRAISPPRLSAVSVCARERSEEGRACVRACVRACIGLLLPAPMGRNLWDGKAERGVLSAGG